MDATRGLLNWAYPNALYVTSAVWQAENAGILPPRVTVKSRDFAAYLRTIKALKSLSRLLSHANTAGADAPAVSIVLIDKVLWIRFEPKPGGFTVKVHADGPADGDVVIVTQGSVVQALTDSRLSVGVAEESGLLRYYGDTVKLAAVQSMLRRATLDRRPPQADPTQP